MPIVLISESLLRRSTLKDGSILRDRVLSGFCIRMNPRKRTFRVATSVKGKQFRLNLGYWPLMSVEEARARAMEVLTQCRKGVLPAESERPSDLPTLRTAYVDYCAAKKVKASSKGDMTRSSEHTSQTGLIARSLICSCRRSLLTARSSRRARGLHLSSWDVASSVQC